MNEPQLERVTLTICSACLDGVGGECHVPGCALWMSTAPDIPIRDKVEIALEPCDTCKEHGPPTDGSPCGACGYREESGCGSGSDDSRSREA